MSGVVPRVACGFCGRTVHRPGPQIVGDDNEIIPFHVPCYNRYTNRRGSTLPPLKRLQRKTPRVSGS